VLTLPARKLSVDERVRIHTGRGHSTAHDVYLREGPSFGNRHDTLSLRDTQPVVVRVRTY
jgi:hypothetical protein